MVNIYLKKLCPVWLKLLKTWQVCQRTLAIWEFLVLPHRNWNLQVQAVQHNPYSPELNIEQILLYFMFPLFMLRD